MQNLIPALTPTLKNKHNRIPTHDHRFKSQECLPGTSLPPRATQPLSLSYTFTFNPCSDHCGVSSVGTMRNVPLGPSIPYKTVAVAKKSIWHSDVPGSSCKALSEKRQTAKQSTQPSPSSLDAPGMPGARDGNQQSGGEAQVKETTRIFFFSVLYNL